MDEELKVPEPQTAGSLVPPPRKPPTAVAAATPNEPPRPRRGRQYGPGPLQVVRAIAQDIALAVEHYAGHRMRRPDAKLDR